MAEALDFYFDFCSPYGYLMSEKIDDLAARHGRKVRWRPILLGVVFRATGAVPLTEAPLKGAYSKVDFDRSARYLGVPYRFPTKFPLPTQAAARTFYWLHEQNCAMARAFAHMAYRALFVEDRDISSPELIIDLAHSLGADRDDLSAALVGEELKARLKAEVDAALARGVFGSPFVFVDEQPFFGVDRLPQIEKWLAEGGF